MYAYSYSQVLNKICILIALTVTKWRYHFVTGYEAVTGFCKFFILLSSP